MLRGCCGISIGEMVHSHPDNAGLRLAMERCLPLIHFQRVVEGKYFATWPVYVIADSPATLTFTVAIADSGIYRLNPDNRLTQDSPLSLAKDPVRAYIARQVKTRLHQHQFRENVVLAYHKQCACCRLKHEELLDAAHIIPDFDPQGAPVIPNGISLCKLHHAAFDSFIIGITPDYIIKVRQDILDEANGRC